MTCPNCGNELPDGSVFCDACGVILNTGNDAGPVPPQGVPYGQMPPQGAPMGGPVPPQGQPYGQMPPQGKKSKTVPILISVVAVVLIIEAIAKTEGIDESEQALDQYLDEMVKEGGSSKEKIEENYHDYYGMAMPFERYIKEGYLYGKVSELISNSAVTG